MTHHLKRKAIPLTAPTLVGLLVLSFFTGCFLSNLFFAQPVPKPATPPKVVTKTIVVRQEENVRENLMTAWKNGRESCRQWLNAQQMARSYLDAYMIGVQKGATSELCMRLGAMGVMRDSRMTKEWHLFNTLVEPGEKVMTGQMMTLHMPFTRGEVEGLRLKHYLKGFPYHNGSVRGDGDIPLVEGGGERKVVLDSTVEYMLSDRAAFLAHLLTPHAKVVLTLREPVDRALSQYNMMIRLHNQGLRNEGRPEIGATAEQFDQLVRKEIGTLRGCGYNVEKARLDRATSELLKCMYRGLVHYGFDDLLYVTRGLYHIHIATWRNYFPDHRMHFVSFQDVARGKREAMRDLAKFMCVRPVGEELLAKWEGRASGLSFGQQAAEKGLDKVGFESYAGKNKYMTEILPETRKVLDDFYRPANEKLFRMLGRDLW